MLRHGSESPHQGPSAKAGVGGRWGQVTLQGSQKLLGVPGFMPELGPGEEGRTPLPTSTVSEEAPPSTGVSGASSSRSVARLYSTICQTLGRPPRSGRLGCSPGARPSAPRPPGALPPAAGPRPSGRARWPGVPPTPAPQGRSPCLSVSLPLPRAGGPLPWSPEPHSRYRRCPAPAARRSWWSAGQAAP